MIHVLLIAKPYYKLYDLSMMDPSTQNSPRISILNASSYLFEMGIMQSKNEKSSYKTERLVINHQLKPFQSSWIDMTHSVSTIFQTIPTC
jgi:hypothetical protein